jgi:hypothetical protein
MIGVGAAGPLAQAPPAASREGSQRGGWTGIDLGALDAEDELAYWVAISLVPGVGPVGFARMLRRFGTARAAWAAGSALLESLPRIPEDAAPALARLQQSLIHIRRCRRKALCRSRWSPDH